MESMFLSMVLMTFPILMYLVFSPHDSFLDRDVAKIIFILTICTSLYLCLKYSFNDVKLLLFCNVPILICYFKKEGLLALILSLAVVLYSYINFDINIYICVLKYLSYLLLYVFLHKAREFNYLFFKISAIIQGFFISFEYFINNDSGLNEIINLMILVMIIYGLTFFCLWLFKLADSIKSLNVTLSKVNEENKLKNSLFKLTHEIKNPIAVCKGYIDMIDLNNIDKSKKYIGVIKSELDRSLNVMNDFMEYSKIKVKKEIFDITMLMDDIYNSFDILAKDKNIDFNYNNHYDEIYLWGDYDRLKQVFVNIIKNSIEAINDKGIIDIDISLEKHYVIVTISDNGVGMNEEELSNMKEMFYTTKKNGTGVGVALSNEIVLAHNGIMRYESEKNKGTKCMVKLPI